MFRSITMICLLGIIAFSPFISMAEPGFTLEVIHGNFTVSYPDSVVEFPMILTNTGDQADTFTVSLAYDNYPEDWTTSMCFGGFCRPSFVRSGEVPLQPGIADSSLSVDFDIDSTEALGSVWFFVRSGNDSTLVDSIQFSVQVGETDIVNEGNQSNQPVSFGLSSIYPNPFNSTALVNFTIPQTQDIKVTAYSITGREISTLFSGIAVAGNHEIVFKATPAMSSGVYLVKLETATQVSLARALFIK